MTVPVEPLATLLKVLIIPTVILSSVPFWVWVERRGSAFMQDRLGPCRAEILGFRFLGLLHLAADAIKVFTKESFVPSQAHKTYYLIAPAIVLFAAVMAFAPIPIADDLVIGSYRIPMSMAQIDAGIIYVFAVGSLGVLGVMLAGWAAGSKYPLLGALRTAGQMLSYEVSLGLSILGALMIYGTLDPNEIVRGQGGTLGILPCWGALAQPVGFILFVVVAFAECNRLPFDLPEGDSELVAGYHTEYSGMKFTMFYTAEYVAMITMSSLIVTLFVGGWQVPYLPTDKLLAVIGALEVYGFGVGPPFVMALQVAAFALKVAAFLWFFIWIRWTLPRFRYDQLMALGWKTILPLCLVNTAVTAVVMALL